MEDRLIKLKTYWDETGVKYSPPVARECVERFEVQNNVLLPKDVLSFYSAFNGFTNDEFDSDMISFWQLQQVKRVTEVLANRKGVPDFQTIAQNLHDSEAFFIFAEFLAFSHVYAVKLSITNERSQVIWVGSGDQFGKIADTFSEFIDLYLVSPGDFNNMVLKLASAPPISL